MDAVGSLGQAQEGALDQRLQAVDRTHQPLRHLLGRLGEEPRIGAQQAVKLLFRPLEPELRPDLRHPGVDPRHLLQAEAVHLLRRHVEARVVAHQGAVGLLASGVPAEPGLLRRRGLRRLQGGGEVLQSRVDLGRHQLAERGLERRHVGALPARSLQPAVGDPIGPFRGRPDEGPQRGHHHVDHVLRRQEPLAALDVESGADLPDQAGHLPHQGQIGVQIRLALERQGGQRRVDTAELETAHGGERQQPDVVAHRHRLPALPAGDLQREALLVAQAARVEALHAGQQGRGRRGPALRVRSRGVGEAGERQAELLPGRKVVLQTQLPVVVEQSGQIRRHGRSRRHGRCRGTG